MSEFEPLELEQRYKDITKCLDVRDVDMFWVDLFQWVEDYPYGSKEKEWMEFQAILNIFKLKKTDDWEMELISGSSMPQYYLKHFKNIQKEHAEGFPKDWRPSEIIESFRKYWEIQALGEGDF